MQTLVHDKQQWETQVLQDFINRVKTPDGDRESVGCLSNSTGDRATLQPYQKLAVTGTVRQTGFSRVPLPGECQLRKTSAVTRKYARLP
ncbi:MAG: hypothetical protein ACM37W_27100 [Actinomycetota bacterium]